MFHYSPKKSQSHLNLDINRYTKITTQINVDLSCIKHAQIHGPHKTTRNKLKTPGRDTYIRDKKTAVVKC